MKKKTLLFLSLLSSFILHLAWTDWCPGYFVFLGFVPLLFIEKYIAENKLPAIKMYGYAALTFSVWSLLDTWWLKNASFAGMLVAIFINTFLYSFVFQAFHLFKRKTNPGTGYFSLIIFWLAFEYFYFNAEISWTWLNLGNAFAKDIKAIQWYEYTGNLGGSFWVLIVNLMIFRCINMFLKKAPRILIIKNIILTSSLIIVPLIISLVIFNNYEEEYNPINVVSVQPNVDPYEKFIGISNLQQTQGLIDIAKEYADSTTDYVICPETAVTSYSLIDRLDKNRYVNMIQDYVSDNPNAKFIVGFTLQKYYDPNEKRSETAQKLRNSNTYYDTYNSALHIDTTLNIQIYHKSQLVVGIEKMPYPGALKFLKKLMVNLGGTFRSHGTQKERENFISADGKFSVSPVICWENVFAEYVTDYVKKGSDALFVITNEGWWGDTQGHRHLNYLSGLRAIENRRSVVRSANTGTSSIINQRGEQIQTLGWWKKGALKGTINANRKLTFYTVNGDYIGRIASFFTALCMLYWVMLSFMKGKLIKKK